MYFSNLWKRRDVLICFLALSLLHRLAARLEGGGPGHAALLPSLLGADLAGVVQAHVGAARLLRFGGAPGETGRVFPPDFH